MSAAPVILSSRRACRATQPSFAKESGGGRGVNSARTSRSQVNATFPRATGMTHLSSPPQIPSRRGYWRRAGVVAAQNNNSERAVRPATVILSSTDVCCVAERNFAKESGGERGVNGARASAPLAQEDSPRSNRLTHLFLPPQIPSRRTHFARAGVVAAQNNNSERSVRPATVILSSPVGCRATRSSFAKESGGVRGVNGVRSSRPGEGSGFPRTTRLTHLSSPPQIPSRRTHLPRAGVVAAQNDIARCAGVGASPYDSAAVRYAC